MTIWFFIELPKKLYTKSNLQSKGRWYGHRSNIKKRGERNKTKLATHIWNLKDQRPPVGYTIKWKIIDKGKPFNPVTGVCRLCLKEKYHILYNRADSSLNTRDEVFGHCPHKREHLLYKIKGGVTWTTGIFLKGFHFTFK